jgi:regulator of replication initiation timing
MGVDEVREYRELKMENARLKKLLANRELEIDAIKAVVRKKAVRLHERRAYVKQIKGQSV